MNDEDVPPKSILLCEFSILQDAGNSLEDYDADPWPLIHYLPLDHIPDPLLEIEIFDHLACRLDTIPPWYPHWINPLDDLRLDPPHLQTESRTSIASWSKCRDEIISQRTHKEVLRTEMHQAWLFTANDDLFGNTIKPRYFGLSSLNQGMPGGSSRSFWALKDPILFADDEMINELNKESA